MIGHANTPVVSISQLQLRTIPCRTHRLAKAGSLGGIRSRCIVPCGGEVIGAFVWREGLEEAADGGPEALDGALGRLSQERLQSQSKIVRRQPRRTMRPQLPTCGLANRSLFNSNRSRARRTEIENWSEETAPEIYPSRDRESGTYWPETRAGQPNPLECRRFSHTCKSHGRDRTGWLPFLDTYRTMCLAPQPDFRQVLEEARVTRLAA